MLLHRSLNGPSLQVYLSMKGHKGEGNQAKGVVGAAERGPLFPRLHVNETEKTGPKAPPRNKMALYEQFTVPSHRFVQPSQAPAATTIYQQQYQMREHGYPYVPYYVPTVPYTNMNHGVSMYAQPSHKTSSSGVTISSGVRNEEVGQNAPRHQKHGKSSSCKVLRQLTEIAAKSLPEQKGMGAMVPAQSSLTNQAEESTSSLQNVPSHMERPHITYVAGSMQEDLSTLESETECSGPDAKGCESPRVPCFVDVARSTCATDEGEVKQAAQLSIFEILTKPTKEGLSDMSTEQLCLHTDLTSDECKAKAECATQALTLNVHCNMQSGTSLEPRELEERMTLNAGSHRFLSSEKHGPQSGHVSDEVMENNVGQNAFKNSTTEVGKVDFRTGFESSEELKKKRNSEVSQPPRCGTHRDEHSDGSILPSISSESTRAIKPKDVIGAIGQQQFWKARKKLLRQQQIFSDQVFQLHKLVKVQQLLAETSGILVDEEMHFETVEEVDAIALLAKRATKSGVDVNKMGSNFKEGSKGQASESEEQAQGDGKVSLGIKTSMPEFGLSAWGYPSFGPWGGLMAAQCGPFNYQPFTGTLPPGSAFGLPYGPLMPGSGAAMMSFGIPYCGLRPVLPGSNCGLSTAARHEGSQTVSVNSNQVSAGGLAVPRYFPQCSNLISHRLPSGGSGKDVPTGSGASVNKSSLAVKTSCFPALAFQWDLNCQTGPLCTDPLDNLAHQSENSSPSDNTTRPNCHVPSSTPSTPYAIMPSGSIHQDKGLARNLDLARANKFTSSDYSKKLTEKEKQVTRTPSHSQPQKEAVCVSVECPRNDHPSNHSALDLFPLVPSLCSSGHIGQKVSKTVEEGQGGIIRAVPRRAIAASKSAAGILLSLQQERQK